LIEIASPAIDTVSAIIVTLKNEGDHAVRRHGLADGGGGHGHV
jgi:hypothetical protein